MKKLLVVILLSALTIGATKYRPIRSVCDDLDSLRTYWAIGGTMIDSVVYTSSLVVDSVALSDTATYDFTFLWYVNGELTYASTEQWQFPSGTVPGGGGGANAITLYAIDTSGTDDTVSNVKLTVRSSGSYDIAVQTTNSSGFASLNLDDDTYTILGNLPGYTFPSYSPTYSSDSTDAILGYDWSVGSPSSASLCRVYGYAYDEGGTAVQGAVAYGSVRGSNVTDTSGVIIAPITVSSPDADTLGYWYIDLYRSAALTDTNKFDIEGWYGGEKIFEVKQLTVPSAESFNLADTIRGR